VREGCHSGVPNHYAISTFIEEGYHLVIIIAGDPAGVVFVTEIEAVLPKF